MKKLLSFLLVATMLVAMFALPAAAEDTVNYEEEFKFLEEAPEIDGTVDSGEYGVLPIHSYPDDKEQFVANEHNQYDEGDTEWDFFGGWDEKYLYLAWEIKTDTHICIPEQDFTDDGVWDKGDYGWMWKYSCVQFILTPGAPKKGETTFQSDNNLLEAGLALTAEGNQIRIAWYLPTAAQGLDVNDWDAVIERDGDTTTYEVRIPWEKSGLTKAGNDAQFGLTYAVAAQEYDVKPGMIEWQNGVLTAKDADSAAVITLTGAPEDIDDISIPQLPALQAGTLPSDATGAVQLAIDNVNGSIGGEDAYIITDPSTISGKSNGWATSILLAPVEGEAGYYTIAETKTGTGEAYSFDSEITDGMIAYIVHSDGEGAGADRSAAAKALVVGDKIGLFGVDLEGATRTYNNATLYVVAAETGDDSSEIIDESSEPDVSEEDSSVADTSKEESTTSTATSNAGTDTEEDDDSSAWIWIVIAVVAVVVVAVVVVIVLKKKKA